MPRRAIDGPPVEQRPKPRAVVTIHPADVAPATKAALVQVARAVAGDDPDAIARVGPALVLKLKSGASYSAEELLRAARRADNTISAQLVAAYLERERQARTIERIPVGESWRYRRRAKAS
jgi:hypothetical protein